MVDWKNLSEQVGFRVTPAQLEWLHQASVAAKEVSLSDWLRTLATDAGAALLNKPLPEREFIPPPEPAAQPRKGRKIFRL